MKLLFALAYGIVRLFVSSCQEANAAAYSREVNSKRDNSHKSGDLDVHRFRRFHDPSYEHYYTKDPDYYNK